METIDQHAELAQSLARHASSLNTKPGLWLEPVSGKFEEL